MAGGLICDKNTLFSLLFSASEILRVQASVCALITASPFSHLQAVSIVDSRWDLVLLPYRLACFFFYFFFYCCYFQEWVHFVI